jgi:two-component system CheB/CheR fusion protein
MDISPPRGNPFPVVGIGASAGGLEAFVQLISDLPVDTGMAFVLVQHLDPYHESLLPELLAPHTAMPVITVENDLEIRPNHIYVIPPNASMVLEDSTLRLVAREPGLHLPIDIFFRSLARVQGSRAIGVVLSGNASDGSFGVRAIKAECGITFAQSEATARFGGMPRNAISTGAIDYVLAPADIACELTTIAKHPYLVPGRPGDSRSENLPEGNGELRRIFALLYGSTKVDFTRYKPTTIRRRIGRRMMVLRIDNLSEYASYIDENPAELRELYRDLLISVTNFFRDPEAFISVQKLLTSNFDAQRNIDDPLRLWVAGCATGEEVYSLAICAFEVLQEMQLALPVQIFGTDISEIGLDRARNGVYPAAIEEYVSPERLRRFFTKIESGYLINKSVRESCIFARHDVTRDPPFSNLDLVSCRNVLIYLDQDAQRHIFPVFHYALKPSGLLMLGSAESAAAASELFIPVDPQHKIYARNGELPRLPLGISMAGSPMDAVSFTNPPAGATALDLLKRLDRVIQSKYSPDAVLINSEFQIVQFRGHTSLYLDPSPGKASLNVLRMATEGLVLPLRRGIHNAAELNATAREPGVELEIAGSRERVTLEVTPITGPDGSGSFYLIVFLRESLAASRDGFQEVAAPPDSGDERVTTLQRELREARDYLRNLTEQYEAHSEELRAANEEARSSNEELQSTNEELRTTKEELQSTNEELTTVNEELQSRNQELNSTNSDLKNLLSAITIPILMVDSDLRVRRFNAAAAKLLELGPIDIGRPVGHIRGRIHTPHLEHQVKNVIDTLHAYDEELQDKQGCWYALNIRPYRTLDDRIAGAVITLQDIDPLKRGLQAAEEARDYAEGMIETVREPLLVLDSDLRIQRATQAFYDLFMVAREETEGRLLYDVGNGQWNQQRLRELIGSALFRSEPFYDFEIEHEFPHIGRRVVRLNGRRIPFPQAERRMLLLSIEDVTGRREIAEIRFQRLFETAKDGIVVIDADSQTVQDVNPQFLGLTGFAREDFIGKPVNALADRLNVPELAHLIEETRQSEMVRNEDLKLKRSDDCTISVDVLGNAYTVGTQPVIQLNIRDVSSRIQAASALRASEQRFRLFVESVSEYALFQMDLNGTIVSWNPGAERLLGWTEKEAIGQNAELVFTPEDRERGEPHRELETARLHGRAEDERWHIRRDGSRFFASGVLSHVSDDNGRLVGFAKVMRDVTSRKEQEDKLQRSVLEKETLVREIHHRVKNNLQVIVSLLNMQARHTKQPQVLAAFEESESRLRAIAHIHERLYASEDLSEIEFGRYVHDLASELVQLHSDHPDQIELKVDVIDLVLDIERAIPLGLVANELILNSIKHGLRRRKGRLSIELKMPPPPQDTQSDTGGNARVAELRITDSGVGLPAEFDPARTTSMGIRLVTMLVRQLKGKLEIGPGPGASFTVHFPLQRAK